jgi:hypothetical protein
MIAEHYQKLAARSGSEGHAVQLARLVLAEYCVHLWTGDHGGPSLAMVAIAEHILNERVDETVAAALAKISDTQKKVLS